jgi:hypothetical protein
MNIVNLTPHTINILKYAETEYEEILSVPPSGEVARLDVKREKFFSLNGVNFYKSVFGKPMGLPPEKSETIYIVSSLFRSGFDRKDLWVPGELIRDKDGQPN